MNKDDHIMFQSCRKPSKFYTKVTDDEHEEEEAHQHQTSDGKYSSLEHLPITRLRSLKDNEQECIKEGYLMKQNGSFQRWKQTYFKIYPQQIYYAKNPSSSLFHEINVTEISIAETSVNNVNNSFKVITGQISLSLSAETRREMEEWVSSFKLASQREGRNLNELSETLSGDHHWYSCTHSRPTFCNVCRDTLPGVTIKGLSCEVCRYKVHKKCAAKAPKSCKWTTLDCIPPEERLVGVGNDEYAMPHQWLEGNITPGQKCIVCGKLCGSKRRMQDFMCLWCDTVVHGGSCKLQFQKRCSLGLNCLSVIPATTIKRAEHLGPGVWEAIYHNRSPLIVFVNSKSGDNQGVKFMRRFKQLLNPAQVFDLSVAGPTLGVSMCKNFKQFRILVCGGDGSVGWVMTELDKQKLTNKCQIGVLPLGTGNDLARVFGWGSACYDVGVIPLVLQQLERARPSMLDRWAIMCKEFPSGRPEGDDISGYEDSIVMHITRMLASNQYEIVIQSAKFLCETIRNFVELVGVASGSEASNVASGSEASNVADLKLTSKCEVLQDKLTLLLRTLQIESEASSFLKSLDLTRRSSTMENLDIMATLDGKKLKWHSDSELNTSMDSSRAKASGLGPGTDNAGFGQTKKTSKQKVFIPKEHLWSRANSLKKAMREIIDHTEKAVDEQNQQTSEAIAQCAAAVRSSNISTKGTHQPLSHILDDLPETIIDADEKDDTMEKGSLETESVKKDRVSATSPDGSPQHRNISAQDESDVMSDKAISKAKQDTKPISDKPNYPEYLSAPSSPFFNLKPDVFFAKNQKSSNTVVYPGTVIARAFQKPAVSDGFISKVLLANANAFCATALPGNEDEQDKLNNFKEKCVMNNYFGVGIDAKISLDFHNKREEHPEKCRSRTRNFIWYGVLGGMELINRTYRNLEQNVHLEVDGHKIHLPSLQGIVVLNIPSYMGGSNFWGTKKEVDGFVSPSFDDRMLEVVAVLGASQMGMSKVFGGMQHHRIAQCHTVKITITDEAVPVQVDGEAWMQPPGIVQIVHKNRAPMLMRDREFEETLRSWHERQVHKVDRMAEPVSTPEMCLIKPLAESVTSLVRSIKAASMINSVVQQELYQAASNLSALAEKVRNQEVINRGEATEFIALSKGFISDVNEKLWTLKPQLSQELETRIVSSLSQADQEMSKFLDNDDNKDSKDDISLLQVDTHATAATTSTTNTVTPSNTKSSSLGNTGGASSSGSGRSWLMFGRKSHSCRERAPEATTIDFLEKKAVHEWDVNEVGLWLDTIGCSEYKDNFKQHDITGPELIKLERHDLNDLGVKKVGHSKRILEKSKQLARYRKVPKPSKWTRKTVS